MNIAVTSVIISPGANGSAPKRAGTKAHRVQKASRVEGSRVSS